MISAKSYAAEQRRFLDERLYPGMTVVGNPARPLQRSESVVATPRPNEGGAR
jgi:hypothetical protein